MVRGATVLAALSGTAAGMGIGMTRFKRDVKLSAELGVNPDTLLVHKTTVYDVASAQLDNVIDAEYASVCCQFCMLRGKIHADNL